MPKQKRIFSERTGPDFLCDATGLETIDYKISNSIITAVIIIRVKVVSVLYNECHTFGSFWHMHQQVLLAGGRVTVWRLQALIVCVKVCHGHTASAPPVSHGHRYSLKQDMQESKREGEWKRDGMTQKRQIVINITFLGNNTIILALNAVYKTHFMCLCILRKCYCICFELFSQFFFQSLIHTNEINYWCGNCTNHLTPNSNQTSHNVHTYTMYTCSGLWKITMAACNIPQ